MSSGTTRPPTFQDKRSRPDQVSFSQSHSQHQHSNAESRKRSTSVNPRSTSRHVEERRTEKVQVTTRETLMTRTRSPDRREGAKQRAAEPRSRDMRQDAPLQEKPAPPHGNQKRRSSRTHQPP